MIARLAAAFVCVVVVAGCSSGDDDSSTTTSTTVAAPSLDEITVADLAGEPLDEQFCSVLERMSGLDPFGPDGAKTPEALLLAMTQLLTVLDQLAATAPAIVEESAGLLAVGIHSLDDELRAVEYDLELAASQNITINPEAYDRPEFDTAGVNVTRYKTEVCGQNP